MQADWEKLMGEYVATLRAEKGWTQAELARRLAEVGEPIHATAVTRLEKGTRSIRLNEWFALLQVLDRSPVDYFTHAQTVEEFGSRLEQTLAYQEENPMGPLEAAQMVETIVSLASEIIKETLERHRSAAGDLGG